MTGDFPARLFRGLRKADWLIPGPRGSKKVSAEAFEPDASTEAKREDHRSETSINWDDATEVLAVTTRQINSQHGVAAVATAHLETLELQSEADVLSHERRPTPENPFHGNLLFLTTGQKKFQRLITSSLALFSNLIEPEDVTNSDRP